MMFSEVEITEQYQKRLKKVSTFLAMVGLVTGLLVLLGWEFDIEILKTILPGLVAMNPMSATCFILIALAILSIKRNGYSGKHSFIGMTLVLTALLISLSCMVTGLMEVKGGIDHLLYSEKLIDSVRKTQNRMAPNTAFNFIIISLALFFLKQKLYKTGQYLIVVAILVSLFSIIGYCYGVKPFYGLFSYIPMALHTAFCFLFIGGAILLGSCDKGIMKEFTNNYIGSIIARKLIPSIIIVPILLRLLILYGERIGLYTSNFGAALFTITAIVIFFYLIQKIQLSVNKADIARIAAEKKLTELNEQLQEKAASLLVLNNELESFSYSISHDLKAPLSNTQGFANLLHDYHAEELGEEARDITKIIIRNTEKMMQLIDDLLEFSLVRKKDLETSYCDMELLVKEVLKEQYPILKRKEYDMKIAELYPCSGDSKMIKQVWINLISNALKYSEKKDKPAIEIGSYKKDNQNVYFVKDNGAGFNMDYATKLFGVFNRLHSEQEFEGTGIGLAIVHRIITRHKGEIWAKAQENNGATFYFSMPE